MEVYELRAEANDYQVIGYLNPNEPPFFGQPFDGRKRAHDWMPFEIKIFDEDEEHRNRPPSDYPSFIVPVFSGRAVQVLHDFLTANGEVLPLIFNGEPDVYFAYNPTHVIDALDEAQSELTRFASSGRVMHVDRYVFQPDKLEHATIFKIPQQQRSRVYVTDAFVERAHAAGLVGFEFVPLWAAAAVAA